jgi:competence protein ComGC
MVTSRRSIGAYPIPLWQENDMNRQSGFSINELLIVVALILAIVVIAVPNLLRAHLADNPSSKVKSTRPSIVQ